MASQAPELPALVVVRFAHGSDEATLNGSPRSFRIRPSEPFDPQDEAFGGTHGCESIHSSGGSWKRFPASVTVSRAGPRGTRSNVNEPPASGRVARRSRPTSNSTRWSA